MTRQRTHNSGVVQCMTSGRHLQGPSIIQGSIQVYSDCVPYPFRMARCGMKQGATGEAKHRRGQKDSEHGSVHPGHVVIAGYVR